MKKYIFFRVIRALFSVVIVTTIVYAMIYTMIPRRQIFISDPNYSKMAGDPDKRVNYENQILERQGYIDYLTSKKLIEKVSKIDASFTADNTAENVKTAQKWADKQKGKWKIAKLPNSQNLIATREIPILERVLSFYSHLIQVDHPWKIQDQSNPNLKRFIKFGWENGPVMMGSGTQHKYLFYVDGSFPFIHQNVITLNLGQSYPTFGGRSVSDVLTSGQGETVTKEVTLSDGTKLNSSMDPHTAQYQSPKTQSDRQKKMFSDDYTDVKNNYADPSMLQNSFVIGAVGVILSYLIAIPVGAYLSRKAGAWIDRFGLLTISMLIALPSLSVIYFDRLVGSQLFGLPDSFTSLGAHDLRTYVLPAVIIALINVPALALWIRRYMTDQRSSDYVKFARAKGLSEKEISRRHIMKNAMIPISNGIPAAIIVSIAGATMTETIFLVPGMGKMLPDAIRAHNNAMVVGIVFVYTIVAVLAVLAGDLLMQRVDPRIKLSSKGGSK
ncbi:ABC transporter permease [Pseudolactococcus yaeyamensis]